jgi:hypothetical protein
MYILQDAGVEASAPFAAWGLRGKLRFKTLLTLIFLLILFMHSFL